MATRYFCDRCSKQINLYSLLSRFDISNMTARGDIDLELCVDCTNEFFNNYMKGPEAIQNGERTR